MLTSALFDQVSDHLREVADRLVLPRFRHLQADEIQEKSPGELVTVADREAETELTLRLRKQLAGSRVVGEEACAADPALIAHLDQGLVWLLDPLDGTRNFASGQPEFAMLVSLLREGETLAAWLFEPLSGRLATAQLGAGACIDGERVRFPRAGFGSGALHGVVKTRFLPDPLKAALAGDLPDLTLSSPGTGSIGLDYPALLAGRWDFLMYWRTLAWDHAPGCLFVNEAGGHARRLDGSAYRAADPRDGLLAARSSEVWHEARSLIPG